MARFLPRHLRRLCAHPQHRPDDRRDLVARRCRRITHGEARLTDQRLIDHYAGGDLLARLRSALDAAGLDHVGGVAPAALALIDQFHSRGRPATLELAEMAGLAGDMQVLDIGCGIGGPARTLVGDLGCDVTGLDLVPDYGRAASYLTRLTGLETRAHFVCASALATPFADATFEVLWTQHAQMNIADKTTLYGECARLLKPGGRLALHDVLAGPGGPPHFPVPWARDSATSFLVSQDELRARLEAAGFQVFAWQDKTPTVTEWARETMAKRAAHIGATEEGPTLGLHLLLGDEFPAMADNYARSLEEHRVEVVAAVLEKR